MRETELYAQVLGVAAPWHVTAVEVCEEEVEIFTRVRCGEHGVVQVQMRPAYIRETSRALPQRHLLSSRGDST
jgi:hypothetical protein